MNIETFRAYCLAKPGTSESLPFGGDTLVFKVVSKIFALTDIENFESVNLKCDPAKAIELRDQYQAIMPGYHMNKKHWNTVLINGDVNGHILKELIDHSYFLVVSSLTKKERLSIELK